MILTVARHRPWNAACALILRRAFNLFIGLIVALAAAHAGAQTITVSVNGSTAPNNQFYLPFGGSAQIAITSSITNPLIFYTTNGTAVGFSSPVYSGQFTVTNSIELQAFATDSSYDQSTPVVIAAIQFTPSETVTDRTPGGGTVTISPPGGVYASNSTITLTANPAAGWTFANWTGGISGTNPILSLTVTNSFSFMAVFTTPVDLAAVPESYGTVVPSPPGGVYPYGTAINVSAVPNPGSYFLRWANNAFGSNSPISLTVTSANTNCAALFNPLPGGDVFLALLANGPGSAQAYPAANYYPAGSTVTVAAVPVTGDRFIGWSGPFAGRPNPLTVNLQSNTTITANFGTSPPMITMQPSSHNYMSGQQIALEVSATGTQPLAYQWYFNATNLLTNQTSSTFQLLDPQSNNAGSYTVVVSNYLGSVTSMVARIAVTTPTVFWTGTDAHGAGQAFWSDPQNWSTGQVPSPTDTVQIPNIGFEVTVVLPNPVTISNIQCDLPVIGGQLSVLGAAEFDAGLNFTSVTTTGSNSFLVADEGSTNIPGNIYSGPGSLISLPGLTTIYGSNVTSLTAGPGSILDLSAVKYVQGPASGELTITAAAGGAIELSGATNVAGDGNVSPGIGFYAAGTNALINLSSVASFTEFGFLSATGGGTILAPNLTYLQAVGLYANGGSALQLPALKVYDSGNQLNPSDISIKADTGGTLDLSSVGEILGPQLGYLQVHVQGGVVDFSGVTNIVANDGVNFVAELPGGSIDLSDVTNFGGTGGVWIQDDGGLIETNPAANVAGIEFLLGPGIIDQPVNTTVFYGSNALFSATVDGNAPLSYQWFFNGTNLLAGATNSMLALSNLQFSQAGSYSVIITNVYSSVTSAVALLSVIPEAPFVVAPPPNVLSAATYDATFNVTVGGTPPFSYQWQFDGTNISGATNSVLTVQNVGVSNAGYYAVIISNGTGSITSSAATLTVIRPLTVFTLAGGTQGTADGLGTNAQFYYPEGIAVDRAGNVYAADIADNIIRKITPVGQVTTLAGQVGNGGYVDGTGQEAEFSAPFGLAVDSNGNVLVADEFNGAIRQVTPEGVVSTVVSNLPGPFGVAVDGADNLYVTLEDSTIRQITPGGQVDIIAGASGEGYMDGPGSIAEFSNPFGIAIDAVGNLYVGDDGNARVRKLTQNGGNWVVSTLPGIYGGNNQQIAVAVDGASNVYVTSANYSNNLGNAITQITPNGQYTEVAGLYTNVGFTDGTGSVAQFYNSIGVAVDASGTVYIADTSNDAIRKGVPNYGQPILVNPASFADQTVLSGGSTILDAEVVSATPPFYQWQFDGTNFAGATTSTFLLSNATTALAGLYDVVVTNAVGILTSPVAAVIVAGTAVTAANINSTWTASNSPYVINGNFNVTNLTIAPGVSVVVDAPSAFTVTGLLKASGTSNNPITISGSGWQGIQFVSANSNSVMNWCVVSGATNGGIRLTNTPMVLSNCAIISNSGPDGGGIYTDSRLQLWNCQLIGNSAIPVPKRGAYIVRGGGLFSLNGGATLQSCLISNNTAIMPDIGQVIDTSSGGGIDCEAGTLTLDNCLVVNNQAAGAGLQSTALGGGVYVADTGASLNASQSTFQSNAALGGFGGGVCIGDAALANCVFSQNQATYGGGLFIGGDAQTMASNCIVAENSAILGGAIYSIADGPAGDFENCTIAYNSNGGLNGYGGILHDCILYYDGPGANEIATNSFGVPVATYCDIEGGYPGAGNFNSAPLFADTNSFLLAEDSPCLGSGDPAAPYNNEAFPPSAIFSGDQNELGAYGGPGAALWPAFVNSVPRILVNGQLANPYQTLVFVTNNPPLITITNGFPSGYFGYTLDGSDPAGTLNYAGPFLVTATAAIRAVAYSATLDSYTICAPVYISVPPAFAVAASTAGGGSVSPASEAVLSNAVTTLTATPSNGWQFLYWTNGASGTNGTVTLTVNSPLTNIQAVFGTTLSVSRLPVSSGTVTTAPQLAVYPYGSLAQLTAIPIGNHYFNNWVVNLTNDYYVSPLNYIVTNPSPTIVAVFDSEPATSFALNLSVVGGGIVSRSPQQDLYASNSEVSLSAAPLAGYAFSSWTGSVVSSANPVNVTVNSNLFITANFISTNGAPPGPPLVAITNPLPGAAFTLPSSVAINAAANDTNQNGAVAEITFYANGNPLATVTNAPFAYVWTNATPGTNLLTAIALDNFGLMTTSMPVAITITAPPPGPAVFTLGASAYSVLENGGSATITVLKSANSLAGTVNFSTINGTAVAAANGVGNYQGVSGSLVFTAGQTSQTISVPVIDNTVYEGNTSFSFALSPSGDGSSVGSPGAATVTIIDINTPSTTNSVLATLFPSAVPPSSGQLEVVTVPSGAQWKLAWAGTWNNSGAIISGLPTGNYPVEFGPASGYSAPGETNYAVVSGSLTLVTNQYATNGTPGYGSLSLSLYPPAIASGQGAWQLQGEGVWHPSGFVLTNVLAGNHIVQFQTVVNWDAPAPMTIYVSPNGETVSGASYSIADQTGATPPSVLQFNDATTPEFGLPYVYNGQLLTDVGYGSGCVVQPQVVLTAGHMVFDDVTFSYVNNAYWFFEEYNGAYDPPAQSPAGWYVLSGYASARSADLANGGSPGEESPASQNEDVAALYFLSPAGRGGASGYLVSQPGGTQWLQATAEKTLVGYPVDDINQVNVGRMHATTPGNYEFSEVTNEVFTTGAIIGYGGNSGGPLCVEYTNGNYYPAGVYIGGTGNTVVRAIDGDVAALINAANVSAATGVNHSGGGDTSVYSTTQSFSTSSSQGQPGQPTICGQTGTAPTWYTYSAPENGTLVVSTAGSSFNTILGVFVGNNSSWNTLTNVGCDYTTSYQSHVPTVSIQNAVAFKTYYIAVFGESGASGAADLNINFGVPVSFQSTPASQLVTVGSTVTLTASGTGSTPLTYSWSFNGQTLSGQTTGTLSLYNFQSAQAGTYTVTLANPVSSLSAQAVVSLPTAPSIITPPLSQSAGITGTASLNVGASGYPAPDYQWLFDGTPVGADSSALNITHFGPANQGTYTVIVSNIVGAVTSPPALLLLNSPCRLNSWSFTQGQFQLQMVCGQGSNMVIQASTNLKAWLPIFTNPLNNGILNFVDTNHVADRFYRGVAN